MSSNYYGDIAGGVTDENAGQPRKPTAEELAEPCESCTCCTRLGCYRGVDSDCPYSENMADYLCPCTGE